jgi:hypothetical protein
MQLKLADTSTYTRLRNRIIAPFTRGCLRLPQDSAASSFNIRTKLHLRLLTVATAAKEAPAPLAISSPILAEGPELQVLQAKLSMGAKVGSNRRIRVPWWVLIRKG